MIFWLLSGCFTLDFAAHNNIHCSNISTETCQDRGYWDRICLSCEQPYDWDRSYDWMDGTLSEGQVLRTIDPDAVVSYSIDTFDGDGTLDAYAIPGFGQNARTTIIYNHGNYGGIEHYLPRLQLLHQGGYTIFVWDYRGYGKSMPARTPTTDEWVEDVIVIRDAVDEIAPNPERVVIYSNSLGAVPAIDMALADPGCALVLEAPLTSLESLTVTDAGIALPDSFLSSGAYNNIERIKDYSGPLFAMIGDEDQRFAVEDVETLVNNADSEVKDLWVLEGVEHGITGGGVPEDGLTEYLNRMQSFLNNRTDCFTAQPGDEEG